jgi:hypothetical protein
MLMGWYWQGKTEALGGNPVQMLLSPQVSHELSWDRTHAYAIWIHLLTVWAILSPHATKIVHAVSYITVKWGQAVAQLFEAQHYKKVVGSIPDKFFGM